MDVNDAVIEISRDNSYTNSALNYSVYIDGRIVEKIYCGEKKQINLNEGEHIIYLKMYCIKSKEINFKVNYGEIVYFKCGTKIRGFRMLFWFLYLFVPKTWFFIEKL